MLNFSSTCGPLEQIKSCSLPVITGAAFVDSINPCAIAVLLILLEGLILTGGRGKALRTGFSFILGLYIAYLIFGLGLFSALSFISTLAPYLHKIIGGLAILIGLLNIKDFFFYGKVFLTEIPRSWRPRLGSFLHKATTPLGAFLIGFVVTLFELPCTGGPYIFALGILSEKASYLAAFLVLLYYNLIFVLPLILIVGLVYFGYSTVEKTAKWKERNIKLLHLIAGLIMLGLGLWVFLS